jgi:hypothetical protein
MLSFSKKIEKMSYDKLFVFFSLRMYMFRDIYTKVSSINNQELNNDMSGDKLIVQNKNTPDNIKVAIKNTENNLSGLSTTNMVLENVTNNEKIILNNKSRTKSHNTLYLCEICNYKTHIKSNYNKHLLSSTHIKINKLNININNAFCCNICDYSTNRKNDYDKHVNTQKHISKLNDYKNPKNKINIHQFIKDNDNNKIDINVLKEDITSILMKEFKNMSEQNKLLLDIANKQNFTSTINNNQTNNQQFNLNMFLNETCKDAMNLSEFIENMQVTMEDMEKTGELGFAKGMSRIIMNNLNAIDVCKRPIHCSDVKRETLYVKNNGVWEKETEDRKKTKEIIYRVSSLNLKHLLKWRDLPRNKGYDKSDHVKNDEFTNLVMEINKMREEEFDKIITSVSKNVTIDKERYKMSGYLN